MKILLVWPVPAPEMDILIKDLTRAGHEIVYWIGYQSVSHLAPQGTVFHDHYDAWDGIPAPALKETPFPPASVDLIAKHYDIESVALPMMDKRFDSAPVNERKHIYHSMLSYWNGVLDRFAPDAVVFATIPHSIYNYILHELARSRGIRTPCFEDTWVASRFLMYENFWHGSDELRSGLTRMSQEKITKEDLGEEVQEYWAKHTQPHSQLSPTYMAVQRSTSEGWGLFMHRLRIARRALLSGTLFSLVLSRMRRPDKAGLKKEYETVMKKPDWETPFVYYPLHFQPERTTSPQGGPYNDQILVVETLAAALPPGWEIFIKEHPSQWWLRNKTQYSSVRYKGYYKRLAKIPGVRLVPITTNTFELTERAQTVAVVTGTSGWEGLRYGKCPLVFGIPWYRDCPGLFRVDSVESCAEAFKKISAGAHTTRESILLFLKVFEDVSIRAYLENQHEERPRYTPEENMKTISSHLVKHLASSRT